MTSRDQKRNLINDLVHQLDPKFSESQVGALKECLEQASNAYSVCDRDGKTLPYSLKHTLTALIQAIMSNEEVAAYFGFFMFMESPENEDNYDTFWDGYCDYVSDPDRLTEQIELRGS